MAGEEDGGEEGDGAVGSVLNWFSCWLMGSIYASLLFGSNLWFSTVSSQISFRGVKFY